MEINNLKLDEHGHLQDPNSWNEEIAMTLAHSDQIELTQEHWAILNALRDLFEITEDTPPMRLLIKYLKKEINEHIDSRYLYRLYPDGPVRLASKHAGLPKPKHCM